eukprot:248538_1
MGNKIAKPKDDDSIVSNLRTSKVTKITLEGIIVNENQIKNTKIIQLYGKDGKLSSKIITVSNELIQSSCTMKLPIRASKYELIVSYWFRKIMENDNEYYLVDESILLLILSYKAYNISIRLTRPLTIGIGHDMHHMHIRQIQMYSVNNEYCKLKFTDASECVKSGSNGRDPRMCIDGNLDIGSFNHSDYSNRVKSNSQSHWMEFKIDNDACSFINDVYDIGYVKIYNRTDGCGHRIRGCILQLINDGKVIKNWTINEMKSEYKFTC